MRVFIKIKNYMKNEKVECICACKKVVDEDMHLNNLFVGFNEENNSAGEEVECVKV